MKPSGCNTPVSPSLSDSNLGRGGRGRCGCCGDVLQGEKQPVDRQALPVEEASREVAEGLLRLKRNANLSTHCQLLDAHRSPKLTTTTSPMCHIAAGALTVLKGAAAKWLIPRLIEEIAA